MDFGFDARTTELIATMRGFLVEDVEPAKARFEAELDALDDPWAWSTAPVLAELRTRARDLGLWNAFDPSSHGGGLTNLQYAPLAELSGRAIELAPPAMNCAAPDTGNMEVLGLFGTPEQQEKWLKPLQEATIRSAFAMTEPNVASSDATNIETSIVRDGDHYVINGRKWWTTGAMNPQCAIFILMGKTNPNALRHHQQSMILVPRETPGVTVERALHVFGYDDRSHSDHTKISFTNMRMPITNLIGEEGQGFTIAQARLGPGRIHHCMRSIGLAEVAIEMMCARASSRVAFGRPLANQGVVREWIAHSRVQIEQLRLLVLKTAWLMDTVGNKGAHTEIQAIKIATPATVAGIIDKAMQTYGGAGISQDVPLAQMYAAVRTLRYADGPDEVHLNSLAKTELRRRGGSLPPTR